MAAHDDSSVADRYRRGLSLAARGAWFEAHEELELAWRACSPGERDFFQGLVHVVVSAYQHGRGRPVGSERQREKAIRRLTPYAPAHRGLDVAALLDALDGPEPDLRHQLVQEIAQPPVAVEEQQQPQGDQRET
jgi:predicted metal-dependent hydrolase